MQAAERPQITDGTTTVRAQNLHGLRSIEMVAEGDAEVRREDSTLTADRLSYNELTDEVIAEGNVRLEGNGAVLTSPRGSMVLYERTGEFEAPTYAVTTELESELTGERREIVGRGGADRVLLEGENQYRLARATYTTCEPETDDWYIRANEIELDYDNQVGVARGSALVFKGVPMLYWPSMSFPLGERRKSGFLVPTAGASNKTGLDVSVPYYWNIAPNYDATIVPRVMARRGLQIGGEFRYMSSSYEGQVRGEWMPQDRVTGEARGLGSVQHYQRITNRLTGSLNLNAVTDDDYFEDLSSVLAVASRRNLLREGRLDYAGGWWNASALMQGYQTLRDDLDAPYQRLPQLTLSALRSDLPGGLEFGFSSEYVAFRHRDDRFLDGSLALDGNRLHAYPQLSLPVVRSGWYITPKVGVHYTRYDLDDPVRAGGPTSISRSLPILSLDSGLFFDRDTRILGRDVQQTLEPRLYYVHIPYRDQNDIPVFDTARFDFGFAQIFSENRYSGLDRVGDANQLTAAVTTRLIDTDTGIERMRATVGQRFHFEERRVGLPGEQLSDFGRTDILGQFSGRLSRTVSLDMATQYSPETGNTQRANARIRYQPEPMKVFNVGYRYSRDVLRDIDVSAQWPLHNRWYGVGRVTRSLDEKRTTEALVGLEYVSRCGCWAFRTAAHRFAVTESDVTNAFFFQLELTGLGGIGPSPINLLRRSVPGYGVINDPISDPYFGN